MDDQTFQQMAQLIQMMQGGYLGSAMPRPSYSRGNEMYRGIAAPGSMWEQGRDLLGPFIGQHFGNMYNPINLPHIAPGAGIGESIMMDRVASRQWRIMQDQALFQMAQGFGDDARRLAQHAQLPRMLGMSTSAFEQQLINGVTDTSAGRALAGRIGQLPGMDTLMGGNPMAAYEALFANRHLFGAPRGAINPLDRFAASDTLDNATGIGRALTTAIRGNNRGVGILPDYGFTRGFRDEDIMRMVVEAQSGGRWGDIGGRLTSAARSNNPNEQLRQIEGEVVKGAAEYTKMFEALGDIMGSRDMDQLITTLDNFSGGDWRKASINANEITNQLRNMEATAQVLNVSKQEMIATVSNIQRTLQGAGGVTATQLAMGFTGGGMGGLGASLDLAQHVYTISAVTGKKTPQDIQRITAQQSGLMAMGIESTAGRALTVLEYMRQTGVIDDTAYANSRQRMISGDPTTRRSVIDEVLTQSFGSVAAGRRYLDDPNYMRVIREALGTQEGLNVQQGIRQGQTVEWRDRVEESGRRRTKQATKDIMREGGLSFAMDPDSLADSQMQNTVTYLRDNESAAAADSIQSVYDTALSSGLSKRDAYARVMSHIHGSRVLGRHEGAIRTLTDKSATRMNFDALTVENSKMTALLMDDITRTNPANANKEQLANVLGTRGGLAGQAKTMLDEMSALGFKDDGGRAQIAALRKLNETDSAAAYSQALELYRNATPEQLSTANKELVTRALGQYRNTAVDNYTTRAGAAAGWSRGITGSRNNLTQTLIGQGQSDLTQMLKDLEVALKSGDMTAIDSARSKFAAGLSGNANIRGILSAEEAEYYSGLAKAGSLGQIGVEVKRQSKVNFGSGIAYYNALMGRNINGVDYLGAMKDQGITAGQYSAQIAQQAAWNRSMADENPQLRATMGQMAFSWMEGNISLNAALGLQEGAPDYSKTSPRLAKRWNKFAQAMGLEELGAQMKGGMTKIEEGRMAFDRLALANPEQANRLDKLREAIYAAGEAGKITNKRVIADIISENGFAVDSDAAVIARKAGMGYLETGNVNNTFKERYLGLDADTRSGAAAVVQERSIFDRRKQRFLDRMSPDGLADLELLDTQGMTSKEKQALNLLAPKLTPEEQLREISKTYGSRESMAGMNEAQQAAAGTLARYMQKKELEEMSGGSVGGTDGKGGPIVITGTITLVDPNTGKTRRGTVQVHN